MFIMDSRKIMAIAVGIAVVILAIAIIWGFVSWVSNAYQSTQPTTTEQVSLAASADTELVARLTTSGEIVGKEDYKSIRISVSRNKRVLEIMSGYNNAVIDTRSFSNDQAAFESFLLAIEIAGFTESKKGANEDERGYCSSGTRTVYEALANVDAQQRLWSGSCSVKVGTFAGDVSAVEDLFEAQIPDYLELVEDVDF